MQLFARKCVGVSLQCPLAKTETWNIEIKEAYIYSNTKRFFIVEFDLAKDRNQILKVAFVLGAKRDFLKPRIPMCDVVMDTLFTAPVWLRMPNLPLHFWGFDSL
jgi:hypothetical protein